MPDTDEASEFYFKRRAKIHDWAKLHDQARHTLDTRLLRLHSDVKTLADTLGICFLDGGLKDEDVHRRLGLRRQDWPAPPGGSVTIAIGWNWVDLLRPGRRDEWPWVGVRVGYEESAVTQPPWNALIKTQHELPRAGEDRAEDAWPLLRPVTEGDSIDALAQTCVTKLESLWNEQATAVDAWLRRAGAAGPQAAAGEGLALNRPEREAPSPAPGAPRRRLWECSPNERCAPG